MELWDFGFENGDVYMEMVDWVGLDGWMDDTPGGIGGW